MPPPDGNNLAQRLIDLRDDESRLTVEARAIVNDPLKRDVLAADALSLLDTADDRTKSRVLDLILMFAGADRKFWADHTQSHIISLFHRCFNDAELNRLANAVRMKTASKAEHGAKMDFLLQILSTLGNLRSKEGLELIAKAASIFEGTMIGSFLLEERAFWSEQESRC